MVFQHPILGSAGPNMGIPPATSIDMVMCNYNEPCMHIYIYNNNNNNANNNALINIVLYYDEI